MRYLLFVLLAGTLLVSGCISQPEFETDREQAVRLCIQACEDALAAGQNLDSGPCLSDEIIQNWVCDVAHSPRQDVDNLQKNQCPAWAEAYQAGKEIHFVEVDPECNFIRAV